MPIAANRRGISHCLSSGHPVNLVVYMFCSYNGWLAGYQTVFDTVKSKVTQSNFAVGYSKDDVTLHAAV